MPTIVDELIELKYRQGTWNSERYLANAMREIQGTDYGRRCLLGPVLSDMEGNVRWILLPDGHRYDAPDERPWRVARKNFLGAAGEAAHAWVRVYATGDLENTIIEVVIIEGQIYLDGGEEGPLSEKLEEYIDRRIQALVSNY